MTTIRYPFHEGCGGPLLTLRQVGAVVVKPEYATRSEVLADLTGLHELYCGTCHARTFVTAEVASQAERASKIERGERAGRTSARITAAVRRVA